MKQIWTFLFCGLVSSWAFGGTYNYMGYGAVNQSMANSTVALPTDGYSQAYNPSLMAFQPQAVFSMGLQGAVTSFAGINQVVTNTPSLGASGIAVGNVDTSTEESFLMAIGYQTPLYKGDHPLHFGLTVVTPVTRLFETTSPNDFQPQYSMYMSDTQVAIPSLSLGMALSDTFAVGAAANIFIVQGSTYQPNFPSNENSNALLATDVRTGVAPQLGVTWKTTDHLSTAISWRGKMDYQSQINVNANIGPLTPSTALNFSNTNSMNYDPDMITAGASLNDDSGNTYTAAIKYEAWGGFNGSPISLTFTTWTGSLSQSLPSTPFRDIYTGHLGFQHKGTHSGLRLGYAYVPSPVPDPNQNQYSNILDSTKHELYAGWGYKWEKFFLDGSLDLDLVGFVDYLVPVQVTKNDSQAIGYPGYTIGGTILGYGMTLTREY